MYSAGKTSGLLRGDASGANRCYVLAHCGGGVSGGLDNVPNKTNVGIVQLGYNFRLESKKLINYPNGWGTVGQHIVHVSSKGITP